MFATKSLSALRALSTESTAKSLGIIGVPFQKGQPKKGVENGPTALRNGGLLEVLKECPLTDVKDFGDLKYDQSNADVVKNMKNYSDFLGCSQALIKKVPEILSTHNKYLVLGGDHAIGFGSIAGHLVHDPNIAVIWVDAHADLNLNLTSPTGNIHGMPVSMFLKDLRKYWKGNMTKLAPNTLPSSQLVYIGLRDIDPYEAYLMNELGIKHFGMDTVDKLGINKVMEQTLDTINPKSQVHVSFDIDALDKSVAPSTGTAVSGGLTLREGMYIMDTLNETGRIQGMDLVEVNPHIGNQTDVDSTVSAALSIIKVAFGYKRSGSGKNVDTSIF